MQKPNITISIACNLEPKERRETLIRCLESIEKSTLKHFEVIIASSILTSDDRAWFEKRFPFITYLWIPDTTPTERLSAAIACAHAPYVLQLDDDTVVKSDLLQKIVEIFDKKPQNVGVLALDIFDPQLNAYQYRGNPKYANFNPKKFPFYMGAAVVFRKSIFDKSGYYDGDMFLMSHENDLVMRIHNAGYIIHLVPEIVVDHIHVNFKRKVYYAMYHALRNHVWIDFKYFSIQYIPFLIFYHCIQMIYMSWLRKSWSVFFTYLRGIIDGILTMHVALKKRQVSPKHIQQMYLNMLLMDFHTYPVIYQTLKKILFLA